MLRIVPALVVLGLILYCFFDVLDTDRRRLGSVSKAVWLLIVMLPVIGAVLWLCVGKPTRAASTRGGDSTHLRRTHRVVAPDDDPAFLRTLDERAWRARRAANLEHKAQHNPPASRPSPALPGPSVQRSLSQDPTLPVEPATGEHPFDSDEERPIE